MTWCTHKLLSITNKNNYLKVVGLKSKRAWNPIDGKKLLLNEAIVVQLNLNDFIFGERCEWMSLQLVITRKKRPKVQQNKHYITF